MRFRSGWVALAGIVSCGGDSSGDDSAVRLPERALDAGADVTVDRVTLPADAGVGVGDAGPDGPVYAGCEGAVDCERVVFVTTKAYAGGLGGIAEADFRCQTHADASQHPRVKGRRFVAWISTTDSSVLDRFVKGTKGYIRPDTATVAKSFADLVGRPLDTAIALNEDGAAPGGDARVWTGTNAGGTSSAANCGDWKDPQVGGQRGSLNRSGQEWTDAGSDACTNTGHLYCFEY